MKKTLKVMSLAVLLATMVVGCGKTGGKDDSSPTPPSTGEPGSSNDPTSGSSDVVVKVLTSIEMDNYPSSEPVKSVDDVDLSGVTIKLNYADGSSSIVSVTKEMITWGEIMNGTVTAIVTYEGFTTTFMVNIEEEIVKTDLQYSFTISNGETFQYDGTQEAPDIRVIVTSENAEYEWYFSYDDTEGQTHNIGQTIPTTPGTYAIVIHLEGSKLYHDVHDFRWFKIVNKATPTVEFTFDSGAEFTYDGTGERPNIGVIVLETGVEYITYFEKDGVNIGENIPTEPGTYSLIIETTENDSYTALRAYRWFRIKSPTLLEPVITFGTTVKFTYDGNPHTPTYQVEPEGLTYHIHYEQNETFYSNEAPTAVGWYALIVEVEEGNGYGASKKWCVFEIQAAATVVKQTPTIEFTFESGASFTYDGTGEVPNIGVMVLEADVEYTTYFEKDGVNIGQTIPTEPGNYSLIIETVENDTYVHVRDWRWFTITAPSAVEANVVFGEEVAFTYDGNPHTPTFVVTPSDAVYTVHYEQNEAFYSNEAPTEVGYYALVVNVEAGEGYAAFTKWVVFHIDAAESASVSLKNLLPR